MSDDQRLLDRFVRLCEIASPTGDERAVADDRAGGAARAWGRGDRGRCRGTGARGRREPDRAGARRGEGWVAFFAHLDTVPHDGPVEVELRDGVFRSAGETILGADNKAAVTVLVELAARAREAGPPPVGLELVFTVAEEDGLRGAKELDVSGAALAVRVRARPRDADRRGDHRGADLQPGRSPTSRAPRRMPGSGPRTGTARSPPRRRRSTRWSWAGSTRRRRRTWA